MGSQDDGSGKRDQASRFGEMVRVESGGDGIMFPVGIFYSYDVALVH